VKDPTCYAELPSYKITYELDDIYTSFDVSAFSGFYTPCYINEYAFFQDFEATTPQASTSTLSIFGTSVNVDVTVPSYNEIFIKGTSSFDSTLAAVLFLKVVVCGNEVLALAEAGAMTIVAAAPESSTRTYDKDTILSWFTIDDTGSHSSCIFLSLELTTAGCSSSPLSGSTVATYDTSTDTLEVVTSAATVSSFSVCLTSMGKKTAEKTIEVEVCGNEVPSVSSTQLQLTTTVGNPVTIPQADYVTYF